MPRVFVGIPTWNRPDWVGEALRSVLAQTLADVRVVVSDNASEPDASAAIEAEVRAADDARVRFHRQAENEGEYGQARFFLRACEEEYLTILHDDDRFEPEYLEKGVARLDADPTLACFHADSYAVHADGRPWAEKTRERRRIQRRDRQPEGAMEMLGPHLRCGFVPISGTLFRTSVLHESRFAQEGTGNYPFEFEVILGVAELGRHAWFTKEPLFGIRFHEGSMRNYLGMWRNPQVVGDFIRILEPRRYEGANERRRRNLLAKMHALRARIEAEHGAGREARASIRRALRLSPTCHQAWRAAARVWLGRTAGASRGGAGAPHREAPSR